MWMTWCVLIGEYCSLPCITLQRGTPINELLDKATNQPHLLLLSDEDLPPQYLIAVEQVVHTEVRDLDKAIYILLVLHYIYDIEYNPRLKDLFEDKIIGLATPSSKKTSIYANVTSAIQCYIIPPDD